MKFRFSTMLAIGWLPMGVAIASIHPINQAGSQTVGDVTRSSIVAETGGTALSTGLTTTYGVLDLGLAEIFDTKDEFVVSASLDEVCYTGTPTINAVVKMAISFERDAGGGGTDHVTMAFAQNTTGAIADGNEFDEEYQRTVSTNAAKGMGALAGATVFTTDQCISVLAKIDTGTDPFTVLAGSLEIDEH